VSKKTGEPKAGSKLASLQALGRQGGVAAQYARGAQAPAKPDKGTDDGKAALSKRQKARAKGRRKGERR